jgi:hypothetical protein
MCSFFERFGNVYINSGVWSILRMPYHAFLESKEEIAWREDVA